MVLGHYAAAYLARPHLPERPFWILLLLSNLAEFLWLALALAGVEPVKPESILDATFQNLDVHMTVSHNLLPNILFGVIVGLILYFWKRDGKLAVWGGILVCLHVWVDYLVGFQHQIWDENSAPIGLNSYARFPHIAILIEWAFALMCLAYFRWKSPDFPRKKFLILLVAFSIGILAWMPNATVPLRAMLPE